MVVASDTDGMVAGVVTLQSDGPCIVGDGKQFSVSPDTNERSEANDEVAKV